jgi:RNA polymerase sigma-70 factor (ECF subfamily)
MSDFSRELAAQIPRLRRYARGLTHDPHWADDLVQDTMERALSRPLLFRPGSNLRAWLFTMLYRLYLNDVARERRSAQSLEDEEPATHSEPGALLDMQNAMARLQPDQRAVLLLVGLEQLSYAETAAILDLPLGTVMSRLSRARERLRMLLSGEEETDSRKDMHLSRVK